MSTDNFEVREQTVEDIDCPDFDSMESLQARVAALSLQVTKLQAKYEKSLFRLANIKHDDDEVKFYTGFPDYDTLLLLQKYFRVGCSGNETMEWKTIKGDIYRNKEWQKLQASFA